MMNAIDAIVWNLQETRRRSVAVWRGVPDQHLHWKPDQHAMTFGEMIRHVWAAQHSYHLIVRNGGTLSSRDPRAYDNLPIVSVESEIAMSEPYFAKFLDYLRTLDPEDLDAKIIDRSDVGYKRTLGDFLLRIAYHDAVHTGQFLSYLRTFGLQRPDIWD